MRLRRLCMYMLIALAFSGCQSQQRKKWSIAVPVNNSKYENSAMLMHELFAQEGMELKVLRVASNVEAGRLVAEGQADFMLSLGHSDFMIPSLGDLSKELRVVMPLFENAIFVFYRSPKDPESIIDITENSKIFLEVNDSLAEQNLGLRKLLTMLNVHNYKFVSDSSQATMMPIWGTFSGELAKKMLDKKWNVYSMEQPFIDYALIIEPRFEQLTIPGRYSEEGSKGIKTLLSTAYLITGKNIDRTELYDIISLMYESRVFFTSHDKSYMAIREDFNLKSLNFPLHAAATAYLSRNEPAFLERHAEYYGLILSLLIVVFGGIQSFRTYMARKKKDRIDVYFLEYLQIKNDSSIDAEERAFRLESLHTKAMNQMVSENLDISDFNIFSQTIKSEIPQSVLPGKSTRKI